MSEKQIDARIIPKHDSSSNWGVNSTFVPKESELIIYDNKRIKIGNGSSKISELDFITGIGSSKKIGNPVSEWGLGGQELV